MDNLRNPFSPGAGSPPPALAGRESLLDQCKVLLGRVQLGNPEKSVILTGLRGVGKTVLLNELEEIAQAIDYNVIFIEAHIGKTLVESLIPKLRNVLFRLDKMARLGNQVKLALGVLKSFIGSVKAKYQNISIGLDINPEPGIADTGDIEFDLPELFLTIAKAVQSQNKCLVLLIDEIQYFSEKELSALIMAMHKVHQKKLPIAFIGAGLPIIPALAGDSKTYAERLFYFPLLGALLLNDVDDALNIPAKERGGVFAEEAVEEIYTQTFGYPYFVQFWAYEAWNIAQGPVITKQDVQNCYDDVIAKLDESFFKVRFDRVTHKEKLYLRAMAELGEGPYSLKNIADQLGSTTTNLTHQRASLIQKGMIYSPKYGFLDFSVPLFGDFMRRSMPFPLRSQ